MNDKKKVVVETSFPVFKGPAEYIKFRKTKLAEQKKRIQEIKEEIEEKEIENKESKGR